VRPAVELTHFQAVGHYRPVAGGREKRWNAGARCAHPLRQRPLRIQFHLDFPAQRQLFESLIRPHVAADKFLHLPVADQQPVAVIVRAGIIRDQR